MCLGDDKWGVSLAAAKGNRVTTGTRGGGAYCRNERWKSDWRRREDFGRRETQKGNSLGKHIGVQLLHHRWTRAKRKNGKSRSNRQLVVEILKIATQQEILGVLRHQNELKTGQEKKTTQTRERLGKSIYSVKGGGEKGRNGGGAYGGFTQNRGFLGSGERVSLIGRCHLLALLGKKKRENGS